MGKLRAIFILWAFTAVLPWQARAETREEILRDKLAEVQRLETDLKKNYADFVENANGAQSVLDRLRADLKDAPKLSPIAPEVGMLARRKDPGLGVLGWAKPIIAKAQEADARFEKFHTEYELYNEKKMEYLLDLYQAFVSDIIAKAKTDNLPAEHQAKLVAIQERLEKNFKEYYEAKGNLGLPADRARGQNLRRFIWGMDEFTKLAGAPYQSWGEYFATQVRKLGESMGYYADFAVMAPSLVSSYNALSRGHGFFNSLAPGMNARLWMQGVKSKVIGRENMPKPEPGVVDVYALMHPHSVYDLASITNLRIPKPATFAAFAPAFLRDKMVDSPEFILVRQGEASGTTNPQLNPVAEFAKRYMEGSVQSLVIMPEGGMPSFGYETRRTQKNFALVLAMLRREGLKVRLIPISQPDNYQLGETWERGDVRLDPRVLRTIIHRPIEPELVDILLAADKQAVPRALRQIWIDESSNSPEGPRFEVVGMPSISTLRLALARRFISGANCEKLLPELRALR